MRVQGFLAGTPYCSVLQNLDREGLRPDDHEDDDAHHQERRHLIEEA
jgi:hypothetical protein